MDGSTSGAILLEGQAVSDALGLFGCCVFEGDRRGFVTTLTDDGRTFLGAVTKTHLRGVRSHFLRHLGRDDLEHLARAFMAILDGEGSRLPRLTEGSTPRSARSP